MAGLDGSLPDDVVNGSKPVSTCTDTRTGRLAQRGDWGVRRVDGQTGSAIETRGIELAAGAERTLYSAAPGDTSADVNTDANTR